jgi:hypothetical protein
MPSGIALYLYVFRDAPSIQVWLVRGSVFMGRHEQMREILHVCEGHAEKRCSTLPMMALIQATIPAASVLYSLERLTLPRHYRYR